MNHWNDCPANPHNGGEESKCDCDEIVCPNCKDKACLGYLNPSLCTKETP